MFQCNTRNRDITWRFNIKMNNKMYTVYQIAVTLRVAFTPAENGKGPGK